MSTIGEAARQVSREFRDAHPAVPWPEIIATRHKLIRDYFVDVPELLTYWSHSIAGPDILRDCR